VPKHLWKKSSKVEEDLGLDDPRILALVEDVGTIAKQLKEAPDDNSFRSLFREERAPKLKTLRLKVRTLSTLSSVLLRLKLEILIVDCE
jgi:hypothetical protein